jgi:hypothetical protein
MKKNCLFLLLAFGISNTYAQNAISSSISPSEAFEQRKGTILEKRFDEVGKVGFLNIQIEYMYDLTTSDKMQCIRFDIQLANGTSGPSALLDSNEVNGILRFLNYINMDITNRPPVDPNTEVSYTDAYNLQIGCFWQKANGWVVYLRTDAENPATETDIMHLDVPALSKTLILAKSELQRP